MALLSCRFWWKKQGITQYLCGKVSVRLRRTSRSRNPISWQNINDVLKSATVITLLKAGPKALGFIFGLPSRVSGCSDLHELKFNGLEVHYLSHQNRLTNKESHWISPTYSLCTRRFPPSLELLMRGKWSNISWGIYFGQFSSGLDWPYEVLYMLSL